MSTDPALLEKAATVRTVYLTGPEPQKTVVSNDVRPTGDRDTLFPLQAALGYSIAQTLFLGKRSVIVEGITDYWIIKALDNCLSASSCGVSLHEDTILIPAGGTSRLMPLASIMLASTGVGEHRLIVLLDSDKEGRDAARRFEDVFRDASTILTLGAAIGISEEVSTDKRQGHGNGLSAKLSRKVWHGGEGPRCPRFARRLGQRPCHHPGGDQGKCSGTVRGDQRELR
jgi:hypothetical protein